MRQRRLERGMVTAETALTLPAVLLFAFAALWLVSLGVGQARLTDASREAARMVARGDDTERAERAAKRAAPKGSKVTIRTSGGEVTVIVKHRTKPLGLRLAAVTLSASAVAAVEADS